MSLVREFVRGFVGGGRRRDAQRLLWWALFALALVLPRDPAGLLAMGGAIGVGVSNLLALILEYRGSGPERRSDG